MTNEISFFKFFIVDALVLIVASILTACWFTYRYSRMRRQSTFIVHGFLWNWFIGLLSVAFGAQLVVLLFIWNVAQLSFLYNQNVNYSTGFKYSLTIIIFIVGVVSYLLSIAALFSKWNLAYALVSTSAQSLIFSEKVVQASQIVYWQITPQLLLIELGDQRIEVRSKKAIIQWTSWIATHQVANKKLDFKRSSLYLVLRYNHYSLKHAADLSGNYSAANNFKVRKSLSHNWIYQTVNYILWALAMILFVVILVLGIFQWPVNDWELAVIHNNYYVVNYHSLIVWLAIWAIVIPLLHLLVKIAPIFHHRINAQKLSGVLHQTFEVVDILLFLYVIFVALYFFVGIELNPQYQNVLLHNPGSDLQPNAPVANLLTWVHDDYLAVDGWLFISGLVGLLLILLLSNCNLWYSYQWKRYLHKHLKKSKKMLIIR